MDDISADEQRQLSEILGEFFRDRLDSKGIVFTPEQTASESNRQIVTVIRDLSENFLGSHREGLQRVVDRFCPEGGPETSLDALEGGFYSSTRQLMTESALNWNKIIVVFTFATELAFRLQGRTMRTLGQDSMNHVYSWTLSFAARVFVPWIREHNGWSALTTEDIPADDEMEARERPRRWQDYRNVFGVAGIALGALALGAILTNKS